MWFSSYAVLNNVIFVIRRTDVIFAIRRTDAIFVIRRTESSHITGYMDDYGNRAKYVAAQCPFEHGVVLDTWRMIAQLGVPTVVLVANLLEDGCLRCQQYWPDIGSQQFGPYKVRATYHDSYFLCMAACHVTFQSIKCCRHD